MPFQLSGREDDVVVGAFALAEDDVFDSGLDDLSGAERAGFGFVDGRIFGVYAGEIQVGAQGLGTGAVKQGIFFRMDGTADVIFLALMHV